VNIFDSERDLGQAVILAQPANTRRLRHNSYIERWQPPRGNLRGVFLAKSMGCGKPWQQLYGVAGGQSYKLSCRNILALARRVGSGGRHRLPPTCRIYRIFMFPVGTLEAKFTHSLHTPA
jgi:hypothetical protein